MLLGNPLVGLDEPKLRNPRREMVDRCTYFESFQPLIFETVEVTPCCAENICTPTCVDRYG